MRAPTLVVVLLAPFAAVPSGCSSSSPPDRADGGPVDAALPPCDNGLLDGDETDTDCGGGCPACDVGRGCASAADCASGVCQASICRAADTCADGAIGGLETDVDCGGPFCGPCGVGDACAVGRDCDTGACFRGACAPTCDDGERDGDETDVDCGGSCAPCAVGGACGAGADCATGSCVAGACAAPACDDGVANGDETGPDCGGPTCGDRCPPGVACFADGDCASRACDAGRCVDTSCRDGERSGDETDVDCGGSCGPCAAGAACAASADCDGGACDAGTCVGAASCLGLLSIDPGLASGVYRVGPVDDRQPVWCDMVTDGGGWTLVGASLDVLEDVAGDAHDDLATLRPEGTTGTVWDGLRAAIPGASDLRFACRRDPTAPGFDVDLAFYGTGWYRTVTSGTDADSCFNEREGQGYERPAPARRDLVGETLLRRGVEWDAGFLEGEDTCDDPGDFTVDLADRGLDSNESDGTDWGEDDGSRKCGRADLTGGAWFLFAREADPRCDNGALDPGESDVDCGGSCAPCAEDAACVADGDCGDGLECGPLGTCVGPCANGRRSAGETDVDCGGTCATGCALRQRCSVDGDCAGSLGCVGGRCHPTSCADGARGGDESDVDCGGSCPRCGFGGSCDGAADCLTGSCGAADTCVRLADCDAIHAGDGTLPSEVYEIAPGATAQQVWCDMTTDGGGWTLVSSSRFAPPNDQARAYSAELRDLYPGVFRNGIWDGMRDAIAGTSDVRFACKQDPASSELDVDLSFYGVGWYREWTTGTDADSCFSEGNGAGYDTPAPARRDNLSGATRASGDDWDEDGYLEGEDVCGDTGDFTVDFDDRGMDSDESDGTDWGEDDFSRKCGVRGLGDGAWFVFVR